MQRALALLSGYTFYYPITMSFLWMVGGIYYAWRSERHRSSLSAAPPLPDAPMVSILIPCHNEAEQVEETIAAALAQRYPDFEVIAVNDGSRDDTGEKLDALAERHARLRVVHLDRNLGKANALRMGTLAACSEFLVCIDGDAMLDEHATRWLVSKLLACPRIGAVTGNPRIRNRSTLLGRLQVGEFSSIIGLIKRTQSLYGQLFTVSGVICAFRRSALHDIGYWADDMLTEDIDVTWRLQLARWDIAYEPNAMCFILMPETLRGLWRQRLRWAEGGVEVLLRHFHALKDWRQWRMWPIATEYVLSVFWAGVMMLITCLWALGRVGVDIPSGLRVDSFLSSWYGSFLALVCLAQFATSAAIDRRYEVGMGRNFYWMIWYPLVYWLLALFTTLVAVPKVLFNKACRKNGKHRATWTSPDRGIR